MNNIAVRIEKAYKKETILYGKKPSMILLGKLDYYELETYMRSLSMYPNEISGIVQYNRMKVIVMKEDRLIDFPLDMENN